MTIDPYILTFSALTVIATIWMGFWAARKSKTAHDFYVAGRSVSVGWNASAISGEYLSAASFMGVAGMVMSSGYDALWYPVCYACGYLFLLLFIAGPLRRFGAYTIPDFAEGRYDSPVFRKIAVVFVLFIGFFYTMPQMKGAGTTLAYIFQDLDLRHTFLEFLAPHDAKGLTVQGFPYWAGVVVVGAVITFNVALGGMKGITLVQAFQYWAKMFAISAPIFVLMAVYGHYGKQLGVNGKQTVRAVKPGVGSITCYRAPTNRIQSSRLELSLLAALPDSVVGNVGSRQAAKLGLPETFGSKLQNPEIAVFGLLHAIGSVTGKDVRLAGLSEIEAANKKVLFTTNAVHGSTFLFLAREVLRTNGIEVVVEGANEIQLATTTVLTDVGADPGVRKPLPEKAPADSTWLNPFGPLTTKAAKAAAAALTNRADLIGKIPLRADLSPDQKMTVGMNQSNLAEALILYGNLTGRRETPNSASVGQRVDSFFGYRLSRWRWVQPLPVIAVSYHADGLYSASEVKERLESLFRGNGIGVVARGDKYFGVVKLPASDAPDAETLAALRKSWLQTHERPLALLYTYSLIIALVCGTAGLPHILVRFYTNPDGVAAKRTTMWVMILIGIFYVFPPIFGVLGRNLLPELYAAVGAKGTDKIVLELPRLLNEKYAPLGSILSGITCAGAFAAFMSTFSGLLVSMTGALAHDVYGKMLRPQSTPDQRMRAFKICAVVVGGVAIILGMQVEPFQINFMVGQAFAIAAASYFPLLFMSAWWRGMTMKGAATGMLTGGLLALAGISLTSFTDLKWLPLDGFWAAHPLFRILCEQPAIWAVPLAIILMVVVSKLTKNQVPSDIRMKMLVLHAPEKLGLKQEYIAEHSGK